MRRIGKKRGCVVPGVDFKELKKKENIWTKLGIIQELKMNIF